MLKETIVKLMDFKRWANKRTFGFAMSLTEEEALKHRNTHFGNIVHTLNHVYVVDDIFRAHLEGRSHGYTGRNTDISPPLARVFEAQQMMDDWWCTYAESMTEELLAEVINFTFVDGGEGAMTRGDIFMHIVNHGNYHRGFVGAMLNQAGITPDATDYPVYLRDVV